MADALLPLDYGERTSLALVYPIAYTVGFLFLFTPSGIGVREGILYAFAAKALPDGTTGVEMQALILTALVSHRIVLLIVDVSLLIIGLTVRSRIPDRLTST
jgi:hypothetical protein